VLDEALLLGTELITNAVVHAGTDVDMVVELRARAVFVSVGDRYSARGLPTHPTAPPEESESGRGLFLVDAFARRWGVVHERTGKHVWFELELTEQLAAVTVVAESDRMPLPPSPARLAIATVRATADGTVTAWGGDAEQLFGWAAREVIGRQLTDVASYADASTPLHERTIAVGRWYGDVSIRHRDGGIVPAYGMHLALRDEEGPTGVACLWTLADSRELLEPVTVAARRPETGGDGHRSGLGRLLGLSDSLVSRLTLDELLEQTAERLCGQFGGDAAYVLLLSEDGSGFDVRAAYGMTTPDLRQDRLDAAEGITGRLSGRQMPVVIDDVTAPGGAPALASAGLRSLVAAPLLVEGRMTGAIHIAARQRGRFTNEHAVELQRASDRLALAIESARLVELERRRRGWLAYLAEASDLLAGTLDLDMTMALVAQLVVPTVAEWCALYLVEDGGESVLSYVWHADEARIDILRALLERAGSPERRVEAPSTELGRRQPWRPPGPANALVDSAARSSGELAALRSLASDDRVAIPLVARNHVLGVIVVGRRRAAPFTGDEIELAGDLTRRAALAIDNARLYQERVSVVHALQSSLLPPEAPVIPGCDVGVAYLAAGVGNEVGGDFYDVFPIDGTRWGVAIGDVCGKGAQAAAVTGLARHAIRLLGREGRPVCEVLTRLNRAILDEGPRARFVTVLYAEIAPSSAGAHVTMCAAGHPLPLVVRPDASVRTIGEPQSLLGVVDDPELTETVFDLSAGDTLVLYTDGVTERRAGSRMLGEEGLVEVVRRGSRLHASAVAARIERAVIDFQPEPPRDDIAVLVIRVL